MIENVSGEIIVINSPPGRWRSLALTAAGKIFVLATAAADLCSPRFDGSRCGN